MCNNFLSQYIIQAINNDDQNLQHSCHIFDNVQLIMSYKFDKDHKILIRALYFNLPLKPLRHIFIYEESSNNQNT